MEEPENEVHNLQMAVCDTCGCPVGFDYLQLHSDWHDSLHVVKPLPEEQPPVANPERSKHLWGM